MFCRLILRRPSWYTQNDPLPASRPLLLGIASSDLSMLYSLLAGFQSGWSTCKSDTNHCTIIRVRGSSAVRAPVLQLDDPCSNPVSGKDCVNESGGELRYSKNKRTRGWQRSVCAKSTFSGLTYKDSRRRPELTC